MILYLSRIHFPVTTLGPGNRIGIWFQGCSIRCIGCVSTDTWGTGKEGISIDEIMIAISPWLSDAEGITISGGEPFDQPKALVNLLIKLRAKTNVDILVYSGHPFEKIEPLLNQIKGYIDGLISDPYDHNASQTLSLRGSDNQRLHCLTPLGEVRFREFNRALKSSDKTFDIMFEEEGTIWLAGIPRHNDMLQLKAILSQKGHMAITTQDKRSNIKGSYDDSCS
ncbi:MAG: radical SAM protein [Tatlockia sp.]|nr:radical SAM protein [Tatlockia sp.]